MKKPLIVTFFILSLLGETSKTSPISSCSEKWQKNLRLNAGGHIFAMSLVTGLPLFGQIMGPMGIYNESWHYRMKSKSAKLLESASNLYLLKNSPTFMEEEDLNRVQHFYHKYTLKFKVNDLDFGDLIKGLYLYNTIAFKENKCCKFGQKYDAGYYRIGYKYTRNTIAQFIFKNGELNQDIVKILKKNK